MSEVVSDDGIFGRILAQIERICVQYVMFRIQFGGIEVYTLVPSSLIHQHLTRLTGPTYRTS